MTRTRPPSRCLNCANRATEKLRQGAECAMNSGGRVQNEAALEQQIRYTNSSTRLVLSNARRDWCHQWRSLATIRTPPVMHLRSGKTSEVLRSKISLLLDIEQACTAHAILNVVVLLTFEKTRWSRKGVAFSKLLPPSRAAFFLHNSPTLRLQVRGLSHLSCDFHRWSTSSPGCFAPLYHPLGSYSRDLAWRALCMLSGRLCQTSQSRSIRRVQRSPPDKRPIRPGHEGAWSPCKSKLVQKLGDEATGLHLRRGSCTRGERHSQRGENGALPSKNRETCESEVTHLALPFSTPMSDRFDDCLSDTPGTSPRREAVA